MFGNTALTATLGSTPAVGSPAATWVGYARALVDIGLPVLLVEPGTKRPLDMRTDAERKRDTEAAAGKSTGGVHLATLDRGLVKKYVDRALRDPAEGRPKGHPVPVGDGEHLNWAVRLAGSGYVVADADTPEEVAALEDYLAAWYGHGRVPGPTVLTPGSQARGHHGGGHWWFKLPEGLEVDPDLIPAVTTVSVPGHSATFSLYAGNAYVLIPPSIRPEGQYHLVSADTPVPPPLEDIIATALVAGRERVESRQEYLDRAREGGQGDVDHQVATWSLATPWEDILSPAGWVDTGTVDSCGCPIWTAPGSHGSPKSATAHVHTCTESRVDVLNPPLHVWTDNPGPELEDHIRARATKTVSKLWTWALLAHGGDMGKALEAAGITLDPTGRVFGPEDMEGAAATASAGVSDVALEATTGTAPAAESMAAQADRLPALPADTHLDVDGNPWSPPRPPVDLDSPMVTPSGLNVWEAWGVPAPEDADHAATLRSQWPAVGTLSQFKDLPSPRYIVDGLLEHKGLLSVVGASGVGKSAVVLDMAAAIVSGRKWMGRDTIQCPVLYVAGEGVAGAVNRLHAWERAHGCYEPETGLHVMDEAVLFGGRTDAWAYLAYYALKHEIGLVIFDTLARMSTGLDENSATDMGKSNTIFDRLRRTTGAGVLYVHHTTRGTTHGRGSTALYGALDSEVLITDTMLDGKPFAEDGSGNPVDSDKNPLPGRPLCVQVSKQKNGPDDHHNYVCLTARYDSVVVTDLEGNVEAPPFAKGSGVTLGPPRGETLAETAERVADYVSRYTSGEKWPTMGDIARGVTRDRLHRDKTATEWRSVLDLAVDKALEKRLIYRVGHGYSTQVPME